MNLLDPQTADALTKIGIGALALFVIYLLARLITPIVASLVLINEKQSTTLQLTAENQQRSIAVQTQLTEALAANTANAKEQTKVLTEQNDTLKEQNSLLVNLTTTTKQLSGQFAEQVQAVADKSHANTVLVVKESTAALGKQIDKVDETLTTANTLTGEMRTELLKRLDELPSQLAEKLAPLVSEWASIKTTISEMSSKLDQAEQKLLDAIGGLTVPVPPSPNLSTPSDTAVTS